SRRVHVELSELALLRLGCRPFHVVLPSPRLSAPAPVRSTGASAAVGQLGPVISALAASVLVVDVTVEGLLHSPELPSVLGGGARLLMISNEHPEILERLVPDEKLEPRVRAGVRMLKTAREMRVTSSAGTALTVNLNGARVVGNWGYTSRPGTVAHWPGGLCAAFPAASSVNGRLVLASGDANLTFKRYVRELVTLTIENDYVVRVEGQSLDAELMRSYFGAWGDREAYAVSHVGWGLNAAGRWEAMTFYDRRDFNGTELRVFAGNFLYSTGANEVAGRYTLGHFDFPCRGCTIALDGSVIVEAGRLVGELA
ncbi:MAG: peptidase M29, partial [Candidatus Tectomicrobia bacterium]|nr:peptidase M29 [Candidatus Tectomicrobia bacterium]